MNRAETAGGDDCYATIRRLAEYETWCNGKMIEACSSIPAAEIVRPFAFGLKTIHATLFHVLEVFQLWHGCVAPVISKSPAVPYDASLTMQQMSAWNVQLAVDFLKALDASHEAGLLQRDRRLTQCFHLVTHGTHHRTQVITMLRLLGRDAPFEAGDFAGWDRTNPE